jgi:hypothetical protein
VSKSGWQGTPAVVREGSARPIPIESTEPPEKESEILKKNRLEICKN